MTVRFSKNVFISLLALFMVSCASGSVILTGTKRPPIEPSLVKLYSEAPAEYEVIGIVSASSDSGWTEQGSVDYAIKELKNQAAKLGANGVIIGAIGESTSTAIGGQGTNYIYTIPVISKNVTGKAIYVSKLDI